MPVVEGRGLGWNAVTTDLRRPVCEGSRPLTIAG
jgi:hypothetical protein